MFFKEQEQKERKVDKKNENKNRQQKTFHQSTTELQITAQTQGYYSPEEFEKYFNEEVIFFLLL